MEKAKKHYFKTVISMMISPGSVLKSAMFSVPWGFSILISTLAFAFFFLMTGLDLYKTGQQEFNFVLLSAAVGGGYGLVVIPLIGVIVWAILKIFKTDKKLSWTVSAFCLSYSGALIYGIIGLVFSIGLGWKTAVAFGVTGVIWAIGPIMVTIREMTKGKTALSICMATLVGVAVLISWSYFGNL